MFHARLGMKLVTPPTQEREARFVALAKAGHPYMGAMVIEDVAGTKPPEIMTQALREQQRIDLERSLEYAKKKLNAGINWKA